MLRYHDFMARQVGDVGALGAAVRDARRQAGWTQAVLADNASVSRQFVINLERGSSPGAELHRVLSVLRALGLGIVFVEASFPEPTRHTDVRSLLDDVLDVALVPE